MEPQAIVVGGIELQTVAVPRFEADMSQAIADKPTAYLLVEPKSNWGCQSADRVEDLQCAQLCSKAAVGRRSASPHFDATCRAVR